MRDVSVYFDDILDAITQIRVYVGSMGQDEFARDRKTQDAVVRNLEIIGEAAGKTPEEVHPGKEARKYQVEELREWFDRLEVRP